MRANECLTSLNIKNRGPELSVAANNPIESNYGLIPMLGQIDAITRYLGFNIEGIKN